MTKMDYQAVIEFMFRQLPMFQRIGAAAYKNDLSTSLALDSYFAHPHKHYKTIHVAGTNGKGSVAHSIAAILQAAGYTVGLFTSPHLVDFRERIRINGEKISKDFIRNFINDNTNIIEELNPSFFELTSEMAFLYFAHENVDIAVIEVGMGGRLDSTNVINPILSIITNIGFDHTQFLGNTLPKIAGEKAGIIKNNIPVVIGETNAHTAPVFCKIAQEKKAKIYFADHFYNASFSHNLNKFEVRNLETKSTQLIDYQLKGLYQTKNICTILKAIELLNLSFPEVAIDHGLAHVIDLTKLNGRWQITNDNPLTICDIGHNFDALSYNLQQLTALKLNRKREIHFVIGFVNDKDVKQILTLFPHNSTYYLTQASVPRAMNVDDLYDIAIKNGLNCKKFTNVQTAFKAAQQNAKDNDIIFVGGSTFVVADFLAT